MAERSPTRVWRIRGWVRALSVLCWLALLTQQFSTIRFVRAGDVPASEVALGWATLLVLAALIALIAFRPFIAVSDKAVTLQGPVRRHEFARADTVGVSPTAWGLRFLLTDGTAVTSIVCQDTWSLRAPRWFDVAEAATGVRPTPATDTDES